MSENVREDIIKLASEKMHRVGIKSISVEDICREMGISKKTFYVYFMSKDDLITALMRQHEEELEADIRKCTESKTIIDLLLGAFQLVNQTKDIRRAPAFVYDLKKYYPQIFTEHLNQIKKMNRRLMYHYLEQGKQEGMFREDLDMEKTAIIFSFLHHEMMNISWQLTDEEHERVVIMARYGFDIFMRGILSDEGRAKIEASLANKQ